MGKTINTKKTNAKRKASSGSVRPPSASLTSPGDLQGAGSVTRSVIGHRPSCFNPLLMQVETDGGPGPGSARCSFNPVPSLTLVDSDPPVPLPRTAEVWSGPTGSQEKVDEVFVYFICSRPALTLDRASSGPGDPLASSGGVSGSALGSTRFRSNSTCSRSSRETS